MWYYTVNGERLGPLDEATMRSMLASGAITIDTLVWTQGMTTWIKYSQSLLAAGMQMPPTAPAAARTAPAYGAPSAAAMADRKDRVAYVLLAVLLGFGVHNFYAGYKRNGLIQLLVSIFSCGLLWPVMWIWSVIEACTVTQDANGIAFK